MQSVLDVVFLHSWPAGLFYFQKLIIDTNCEAYDGGAEKDLFEEEEVRKL